MKKNLIAIFSVLVLAFGVTSTVFATSSAPYIVICHHTPVSAVTLTFQNIQSYAGHLATPHNNQTFDTDGACVSPTATPVVSQEPTVQPSSEPTVTPEDTIVPTEVPTDVPTAGPTVEPTTTPTSNGGDGKGDGKSDGLSSCPSCTQAPKVMPLAPPATGRGN